MTFFARIFRRMFETLDGFVRGERDYEVAIRILPFFYYLLFFSAFTHLEGLNVLVAGGGDGFEARWPLWWSVGLSFSTSATIVFVGWTLSALTAAVFPLSRTARIAAFVGMFSYHAYLSSFGQPNHQFDHLLWVSFIFIFLPSTRSASPEMRRSFSLVFWCAQTFMLLTYSMAGFGKIAYGFVQAYVGQANAFSFDAGALHIATQLLRMEETTLLGPLLVQYPLLGFVPFLCVLYIQLFSIVVAFRPPLHRLWGLLLILFHIGTFLTMRAIFTAPTVLLMVLFLSSPFAPENWSVREILRALPLSPTLRKIVGRVRTLRS